jgi:hypothetical protein
MKYLSKKEMSEIADEFSHLTVGQVERTNHNTNYCSGSSNSMIVRRTKDGYNAKCFRCARGGKRNLHNLSTLKSKSAGVENNSTSSGHVPSRRVEQRVSEVLSGIESGSDRYQEQLDGFGIHGKVWLNKYGITEHEVLTYGICYDLEEDSIIFPTFDADGLAGFQERCLRPGYDGPKYLSYFLRPAVQRCATTYADMAGLVLVEDFVSAIKVGRIMQAIPLRTTNLSSIQKRAILDLGVKDFFIWLDDDNMIVKRHQLNLKRELDKIGYAVIIKTGNDPKYYSTSDIICIIYGDH